MEHRFFKNEHILTINNRYCLHQIHQCFINITLMLHRCFSNEQDCFFGDDIDDLSIFSMCS